MKISTSNGQSPLTAIVREIVGIGAVADSLYAPHAGIPLATTGVASVSLAEASKRLSNVSDSGRLP
jgi:hypothetical protein